MLFIEKPKAQEVFRWRSLPSSEYCFSADPRRSTRYDYWSRFLAWGWKRWEVLLDITGFVFMPLFSWYFCFSRVAFSCHFIMSTFSCFFVFHVAYSCFFHATFSYRFCSSHFFPVSFIHATYSTLFHVTVNRLFEIAGLLRCDGAVPRYIWRSLWLEQFLCECACLRYDGGLLHRLDGIRPVETCGKKWKTKRTDDSITRIKNLN